MTIRGRGRAPALPPDVRREEIVDAAVRVFAHTPYRATRTAVIAAAAGIAEGTIFRHFNSKHALYLAALERVLASVQHEYRRIAEEIPDAVAAIRAMASCSQERATTNADELRLRQRAAAESEDAEVRALLLHGYRETQQIVADVMCRGQRQGAMDADASADAAAWLFMAGGMLIEVFGLLGVGPEERLALCRELGTLQRRGLGVDPV